MDSSTIIFIATIAVAFIVLRWLISPIPQSNEYGIPTEASAATSTSRSTSQAQEGSSTRRRDRRQVSDSMIEVVAAIAPGLTREQIEYDLQRTGSVELTVNNYMENGGLPFPPNSSRTTPPQNNGSTTRTPTSTFTSNSQSSTPKPPQIDFSSVNLLKKYSIDASNPVLSDNDLLARKQKMILGARERMKQQLEKST